MLTAGSSAFDIKPPFAPQSTPVRRAISPLRRPRRGKHDRAHQGALSPACLYYRSCSRVGAGTLQPAHHRQRMPSYAQRRRSQRLHLRNASALTIYIVGQPPDTAQAMLTSPPPSVALPNSHAPIARASRHPPAHDRTPNAPRKRPRFGWPPASVQSLRAHPCRRPAPNRRQRAQPAAGQANYGADARRQSLQSPRGDTNLPRAALDAGFKA